MLRSMYAGVSGLKSHQTKMDVIGNNIANINTAGYKKSRVVFQDTLYQMLKGSTAPQSSLGGTNAMGVGLGVGVGSIDQIHTAGPLTVTNKMTDLAIDGNGYFILGNGTETYYTRAGAFDFDGYNTLVSSADGYNVMGWMADPQTYEFNTGLAPTSINISGYKSLAAKATSEMTLAGNLNAATGFDAGLDEQQSLKFSTIPNGGAQGSYFRLRFDGQNTDWIQVGANSGATARNIQEALESLSNIGSGNVQVSWDNTQQKYNINFTGELARTDLAKLIFLPGPEITFDAGTATVQGGSQHTSLAFADFPEGGTANSYFQLAVGNQKTALIQVGATTAATAANISAALTAIGNPAAVAWDAVNQRYNIDFTTDPGAANVVTLSAVTGRLDDGGAPAGIGTVAFDPVDPLLPNQRIMQFNGGTNPTAGGNFILTVDGENTGLIQIGTTEEQTANNIQDALNELLGAPAGTNLATVAWDSGASNFVIDFNTDPGAVTCSVASDAAAVFVGGAVTYGTQHPAVQFATHAEGGTEGGAFTLTIGSLTTGPIIVGADTATTASNIEAALNELDLPNGANATVTWDNVNNRYQIDFDIDPHQALTVTAAPPFSGGNAAISVVQEGHEPLIISPRDEVQSLSFSEDAEGGTPGGCFKLSYDGQTTEFIRVGADTAATAANIQTALESLSNIGTGNVAVAWNEDNKRYDITFQGDLQRTDVKSITCSAGPLFDGGAATVSHNKQVSLSFAVTPGGGTTGGMFSLSVGGRSTGLIAVGATEADTATNIQTALNAITLPNGGTAVVTWNTTDNRYDIVFSNDPSAEVVFNPVEVVFDGGAATIAGTQQNATLAFATDPEGGTEGGNFILSIGGRNTTLIEVGSSPQATALKMQNALNDVLRSLPQGATATVAWDGAASQYTIDFNVDPGAALTVSTASAATAVFDGGQEKVSGTQNATLAFAEDADGGTEGGTFQLWLGDNYNNQATLKTGSIMVGKTPGETAANIQAALNALTLPNSATATVTWNPLKQKFDITFSADPGKSLHFNKLPFDGGTTSVVTTAEGSAVLDYPEEENSKIISKEVYDSQGGKHTVYFRFFKYEIQPGDYPNQGNTQPITRWACDLSLDPKFEAMNGYVLENDFQAVDITGESPTVGTGTKLFRIYNVEFDENGGIKEPSSSQVTFPINSQIPNPGNGTANLSINIDFQNVTQYNAVSDVEVDSLNGNGSGKLLSFNIDTKGNLNGVYDNGETRSLARIALRTFKNPAGLIQTGGTLYQNSVNAGALAIGEAGDPGLGTIRSNRLEMSNVDLSEEFTDMIVAQRGFQANSRIITTSDEMIQELVNLKR